MIAVVMSSLKGRAHSKGTNGMHFYLLYAVHTGSEHGTKSKCTLAFEGFYRMGMSLGKFTLKGSQP